MHLGGDRKGSNDGPAKILDWDDGLILESDGEEPEVPKGWATNEQKIMGNLPCGDEGNGWDDDMISRNEILKEYPFFDVAMNWHHDRRALREKLAKVEKASG